MTTRIEIQVPPQDRHKRLEDFLFDRFGGLSRMYLREVVKLEKCEVNGRFENVGYRLRPNDFIEIELDLDRQTAMRPEKMDLDVVYEDADLIVLNKPAGMLVHPTHRDKSGTLLNGLTYYLNYTDGTNGSEDHVFGKNFIRPGLIHRLDKQTSGLLAIAKNVRTHRIMARHFQRKLVEKRYLALVEGVVEADEGVIEAKIGRFAELKLWSIKEDGKDSVTRYWVRQRFADTTLVELEPVTGRTNQLRIHCAHFGHPIVGDVTRGGREFERLCLHAERLGFTHPRGGVRYFISKCGSFPAPG